MEKFKFNGPSAIPFIKKRKIKSLNLVDLLRHREIFNVKQNTSPIVYTRQLYQCIVPNFTVHNVDKPNCLLRKFTNDGRYLIAISSDQTSTEIYKFQGSAAGAHLLTKFSHKSEKIGYTRDEETDAVKDVQKEIFDCFFKLKHVVSVARNGHQLHREFSLFTEDNRYMIIFSSITVQDELASFYDLYQNNESIPVASRAVIEDYTMYLIDIERGVITDRRHFKTDRIFTNRHHGVYLFKNTLAVLSVQHQTIHIFHITPDGLFVNVRQIGRFCFEDDKFLVDQTNESSSKPSLRTRTVHPFREVPLCTLKHRLMAFLFNFAKSQSQIKGSNKALRKYYNNFNLLANLKMLKMQLLDEEHLLIKYEAGDSLFSRVDINKIKNWNLFMVYNYKTTKVLNVYPQFSEELAYIYEGFSDFFRHPFLQTTSPSNNIYARYFHDQFKQTVKDAKNGSRSEAIKMILAVLPLNCQSHSSR